MKQQTSEVQFQLRGRCNIYVVAPRLPSVAVLNGGVINVDHHHVGPVPVRAARRGSEPKLVKPECISHRRHIESEGMMTVCELGLPFTKLPIVQSMPRTQLSVTDANAIYETLPFGIPRRLVACTCTVDDGDLTQRCCAKDGDVCSCTNIGLEG